MSSHSGGGGGDLLSLICPELGVAPLVDPGTDLEDELPSPAASPVAIGNEVAPLPAPAEEDIELAQVFADFGTLLAIVTPVQDPQGELVVTPVEYRVPDVQGGLFVVPAGPTVMSPNFCI